MSLSNISLIISNFGNGKTIEPVLDDWLQFLGGKPAEIVVVDGGSDEATQATYMSLFRKGTIDKLQLIRPTHPENSKARCYVQEYQVAALASRPYLLFIKLDTICQRRGSEQWVRQSIEYLDRPEVFAISGAMNYCTKVRDAWPGWHYSDMCTENFALMKREMFMRCMEEFAGAFIRAGFVGPNPAATEDNPALGRFLLERGFLWYMKKHNLFTLVRQDSKEWAVLHTNLAGQQLLQAREDLARWRDIESHLRWRNRMRCPYAVYYGHPVIPTLQRFARIWLGASFLGSMRRQFLQGA